MTTLEVTQFEGQATHVVTCWCSIRFAIPAALYDYYQRSNSGRPGSFSLHCPLGHTFIPAGRSEADNLRDELARVRGWYDQANARNTELYGQITVKDRQISARKAVATKLRKRIAAGKCPCCHTRFKDLAAHMRIEHPKWNPEKAAEALTIKHGSR